MVRRISRLRPDARPPVDIWGKATTVNGVTFRESMPPGTNLERSLARIHEHFAGLADSLEPRVGALREIIAQHEPVELISSVVIPSAMGLTADGAPVDDAQETFSWQAKIEYLVGLALTLPRGTGRTPRGITDRVINLLGDVFDAANARHMVDSFALASSGHAEMDQALFMLRSEHLLDRMPGYATHLERIDSEVFDRHRDFYVDTTGFNPADVTRAVRRKIAADGRRANEAMRRQRLFKSAPQQAAEAMLELVGSLDESRNWTSESFADDTSVPVSEVDAMLRFFSTTFEAQPEFRLPTEANLARHHPCIDLGAGGSYFVADPWSLLAAVHPRLAQAAADEQGGPLDRYRAHREKGHQRLVAGALREVFGDMNVVETQHYVGEEAGPGEIDVLVSSDWPLVVEAKAHGLTDAGRRGAPARVATVARKVVDKALTQTERACTYIYDEGGRDFANHQGGDVSTRLPADVCGLTEILVTFERMDPLASAGPGLVGRDGRATWMICLADLLMVGDVLTDAASFHHYARSRARANASGMLIAMESDALGSYLIDRLVEPLKMADHDPEATVMLDYQSSQINDYFTLREIGMEVSPPTTGVPTAVAEALAATPGAAGWSGAVDAVMSTQPERWKSWRSYYRRHRSAGRFDLSESVNLVIGATGITRDACLSVTEVGVQPRGKT